MDVSSVRLGRRVRKIFRVVSVPNTSAVMITGPSADRIAVILSPPTSGRITIGDSPALTDTNGMVIQANTAPVQLDVDRHGGAVTEPLYAIHQSATVNYGVWEFYAPND